MKGLISAAAILAGLLFSQSLFALTYPSGTLNYIGTDFSGTGYIFQIAQSPSLCSSGQFSMTATAPGYKDQVATLMLAYAMGSTVTVVADGTCSNNRANVISVEIVG